MKSKMHPIIFNTEMVRAILENRKTVTRRVVKFPDSYNSQWSGYISDGPVLYGSNNVSAVKSPYRPGDIMYVRETFFEQNGIYYFKADGKHEALDALIGGSFFKWRPSIHMPRAAARIFLRVKNVRAERLQNVDGYGVLAEGVDNGKSNPTMGARWENMQLVAFSELWNGTIKKSDLPLYGWESNPWVWVIEFERIEIV